MEIEKQEVQEETWYHFGLHWQTRWGILMFVCAAMMVVAAYYLETR